MRRLSDFGSLFVFEYLGMLKSHDLFKSIVSGEGLFDRLIPDFYGFATWFLIYLTPHAHVCRVCNKSNVKKSRWQLVFFFEGWSEMTSLLAHNGVKTFLNRSSRWKRGMASNPLFIIPVSFLVTGAGPVERIFKSCEEHPTCTWAYS